MPNDGDTSRPIELTLAENVYTSLARGKFRDRISRNLVAKILAEFDLTEHRPTKSTPILRLRRLRFVGEKHLTGDEASSQIDYEQAFEGGVNVILIPDNDVGKSSILKTVKLALTGDDSNYDVDVKGWITDIWLTFSLDGQMFTVLLSTRGGLRAALVLGEESRPIVEAATSPSLMWDVTGTEAVRSELQRFFFQRLGLEELSWTQQLPQPGAISVGSTSWLTYFQALQILDDHYLLCDPEHSYGHQEGLILSAFLGLSLAEPLNRLGVEAQRSKKEQRAEQSQTAEQVRQAEEEIRRHEARIAEVRATLVVLDAAQRQRREVMRAASPANRLVEVQATLAERAIERARLLEERDALGQRIRRARAEARRLREAVKLRLHFTSLTVQVCPNCDADVAEEAVCREEREHLCRLCGRAPRAAPAEEIADMEAQAEMANARADEEDRDRSKLNTRIGELESEIARLTSDSALLQQAAVQGMDFALPTPPEEAERTRLIEEIGGLQAEIRLARLRTDVRPPEEDLSAMRVKVLEKAREILRGEAAQRNAELLSRLSALTQDVVHRIGADRIGDVTVHPLGDVHLSKNGVRVKFSGSHNQGERLRVKLAFFLAMMRLGRGGGPGRHPGLLLIDQPGGGEMVPEDATALAEVFWGIDRDLYGEIQILCFTARPEFADATNPTKVYGPQAGRYAF